VFVSKLFPSVAATFALCALGPQPASAQRAAVLADAVEISARYRIVPNVTYVTANNWDAKLDVYQARGTTTPAPTLIYIHGGNWIGGSKEGSSLTFLPFLAMGWNVVNVEYRVARVSLAPAAVEDCRCALRWVYRNAKEYNIDTARIVTMGNSAGGHLALITAMLPSSAGLDRACPGPEELKVAAAINWYGFADVADLLEGPNMRLPANTWLGSQPDRAALAQRISPITHARTGVPPVLTVHGDADQVAPYQQAVRLHQALDKAKVPNQLITIPKGGHGGFSQDDMMKIYGAIQTFLTTHVTGRPTSSNP
jgi:acetyl esterase/lipase